MSAEALKVTVSQLARNAYLYIRQSTLKQVLNNTESTVRQYDLRQRAIALGWPAEQIIVVDVDQGHSGASAADREGFQRLVADVSMGRAGIVLGLECSRLARNNADWHRLLEICALTGTLICDEDGLYDPGDFNDRMLLASKEPSQKPSFTSSGPGCAAGSCRRPGADSCGWACRSAWSTTAPGTSCSTPTPGCSRRSGTCSRSSPAPARRAPWWPPSPPRNCRSRCGSAPGRARASWPGCH